MAYPVGPGGGSNKGAIVFLFFFCLALVGIFFLMRESHRIDQARANWCLSHGYTATRGGGNATLCVDPKTNIVRYPPV